MPDWDVCFSDFGILGQRLHLLVSSDDCMTRNESGYKSASLGKIDKSTSKCSGDWPVSATFSIETSLVTENRDVAAKSRRPCSDFCETRFSSEKTEEHPLLLISVA